MKDWDLKLNHSNPLPKEVHSILPSPLEGNEISTKILRQESALMGVSSRVYFQSFGRVPFDWEVQPGKPKSPPKSYEIPPLSPPPAFQSALVLHGSYRTKGLSTPSRSNRKLNRRQMRPWRCVLSSFSSSMTPLSLYLSKCFGK